MSDFEQQLRDGLLRCAGALGDERFRLTIGDDGAWITDARGHDVCYLEAPDVTPDQAFTPLKKLTGIAGWRLRAGESLKRRQLSIDAPEGDVRTVVIEGTVETTDPRIVLDLHIRPGTGRTGLVIGRFQPPHMGHVRTIERMLEECDTVIVCVGSTQLKAQVRHPFPWEVRKEMLERLFGSRVRMLPLVDIDSLDTKEDWLRYVLKRIRQQNLPEPTDFYAGSIVDARWYSQHFAGNGKTCIRQEPEITTYEHEDRSKRLHIAHDPAALPINATDLRTLIELRDPEWMAYVPEAIHDLVDYHYPGDLRLPVHGSEPPHDAPAGTRYVAPDGQQYERAPSGEWRPMVERMTPERSAARS